MEEEHNFPIKVENISETVENTIEKTEEDLINVRLKKLGNKLKTNINLWSLAILAFIIYIATKIRTRNIAKLKDVTTNDWTLGPDLDPFLFLRWAENIVENGSLFVIDMFRNVPLGYSTAGESRLLSYMIAWTYDLLNFLPNSLFSMLPGNPTEVTVTYAAIIFPVIFFALTIIAFYFLTREIFYDSFDNKIYPNVIALIASFLLSIIPALLPRTIAGIPEKESAAFLFIFLSFYFLLISFKSRNNKKIIVTAALSGISTAILGLIWGGVGFVFMIIGIAFLGAYFIGTINKKRLLSYFIWVVVFSAILLKYTTRFSVIEFVTSISTAPIVFGLLLGFVDIYFYKKIRDKKIVKYLREKKQLSRELSIFVLVGIFFLALLLIYTTVIEPGFLSEKITSFYDQIIRPLGANRFTRTVAENRQPFFVGEWKSNFGPVYNGIPIFFWLFMVSSLVLFFNMVKKIGKKQARYFTISFATLIFLMVFSRYSSSSSLNGTSTTSLVVYAFGALSFAFTAIYILYKYNKNGKRELLKFDFGIILLISMFLISLMAARSGVRFVMVLVPPISILVSYLVVYSFKGAIERKEGTRKLIAWVVFAIILIATLYGGLQFYKISNAQASSFHPSTYQFQWQEAMSWVRENTPQDAVFSHWWDYGYWLQSIGKRATVLDGGNAIVYWNHLLGRHVLTGPDDVEALSFLKTHEATHLLIDSTDIGKYSAFSSIGGDENNDRFSYIPTLLLESSATKETRNGVVYAYPSGINLDEDIIYELNGTTLYLAQENTALGAILIEISNDDKVIQANSIFVKEGQQIQLPLKYVFYKNKLYEFDEGIEAGFFIMTSLATSGSQAIIEDKGAGFYLSKRTVNSLLVRKFLFEEEGAFKLVHTESHEIINNFRDQGTDLGEFVYFQGNFLGPIKIWEINYPASTKVNPAYLETKYPDERFK